MDSEGLEETVGKLRAYKWSLLFGVLGVLLLCYGFFITFQPKPPEKTVQFQAGTASTLPMQSDSSATVMVDIAGAVKNPGVYTLPEKSRLQDVIQKANGFTQDANTLYIAKSINLAQMVTDGMKIYIPFQNETGEVAGTSTQSSTVSINQASSSELEALPGIGVQTAAKIISLRPYNQLDDLVSKKALSQSLYQKLKEQLSL